MSLLSLNVVNKPADEGLFCQFFDDALPLTPPGSEYLITEIGENFVMEDGITKFITE